jgi:formylmethanofuran dehydrogenase subunit E
MDTKMTFNLGNLIVSETGRVAVIFDKDGNDFVLNWTNGEETRVDQHMINLMVRYNKWRIEGNE